MGNSGGTSDLSGVVYGGGEWSANSKGKTASKMRIIAHKMLKVKAESINSMSGKNNNIMILGEDRSIRLFALTNKSIRFLCKLI